MERKGKRSNRDKVLENVNIQRGQEGTLWKRPNRSNLNSRRRTRKGGIREGTGERKFKESMVSKQCQMSQKVNEEKN